MMFQYLGKLSVLVFVWFLTNGSDGLIIDFHNNIKYNTTCGQQGCWSVEGKVTLTKYDLELYRPVIVVGAGKQICHFDTTSCEKRKGPLPATISSLVPHEPTDDVCYCVKSCDVISIYVSRHLRADDSGQMLQLALPGRDIFRHVNTKANIGRIPGDQDVDSNKKECQPLQCTLPCITGYQLDVDGCSTCRCRPVPVSPPVQGKKDCEHDGKTYKHMDTFVDSDGCNSCFCNDGNVGCSRRACLPGDENEGTKKTSMESKDSSSVSSHSSIEMETLTTRNNTLTARLERERELTAQRRLERENERKAKEQREKEMEKRENERKAKEQREKEMEKAESSSSLGDNNRNNLDSKSEEDAELTARIEVKTGKGQNQGDDLSSSSIKDTAETEIDSENLGKKDSSLLGKEGSSDQSSNGRDSGSDASVDLENKGNNLDSSETEDDWLTSSDIEQAVLEAMENEEASSSSSESEKDSSDLDITGGDGSDFDSGDGDDGLGSISNKQNGEDSSVDSKTSGDKTKQGMDLTHGTITETTVPTSTTEETTTQQTTPANTETTTTSTPTVAPGSARFMRTGDIPTWPTPVASCGEVPSTSLYQVASLTSLTNDKSVLCDTTTDEGGWVVFQSRSSAEVSFYRNWTEYSEGFGDLKNNFWLGLKYVHQLCPTMDKCELRVDLRYHDKDYYAKYGKFSVASQGDKYRLNVDDYSGTAGNGLMLDIYYGMANGMKFTTFDNDNDRWGNNNCAFKHSAAWWYRRCQKTNLNGQWMTPTYNGLVWYPLTKWTTVEFTEMKLRPR